MHGCKLLFESYPGKSIKIKLAWKPFFLGWLCFNFKVFRCSACCVCFCLLECSSKNLSWLSDVTCPCILSAGPDLIPDSALIPCFCVVHGSGTVPSTFSPLFANFSQGSWIGLLSTQRSMSMRGREAHTGGRFAGISEKVRRWELPNIYWEAYSVSSMFQKVCSKPINLIVTQH